MKKLVKIISIVTLLAVAFSLVACGGGNGPSIPEDAPTANQVMYARGYDCTLFEGEPNMAAQGLGGTGTVGIIRSSHLGDETFFMAIYFDTEEHANAVYENAEEHIGEMLEDWQLKKHENCVYFGKTDAVEAFEGKTK